MAEYIDKEKLIKQFQSPGMYIMYGMLSSSIIEKIKIQPSIDQENLPVVKGLRKEIWEAKRELKEIRSTVADEIEMTTTVKLNFESICNACKRKAKQIGASTGCNSCPIADAKKEKSD